MARIRRGDGDVTTRISPPLGVHSSAPSASVGAVACSALEERLEGLRRQMEAVEAQGASLYRTALAVEEECRRLDEGAQPSSSDTIGRHGIAPDATALGGAQFMQRSGGQDRWGGPLRSRPAPT